MQRARRLVLSVALAALMLAGCDLKGGQAPGVASPTVPVPSPTVPSVLVSSTMQNPAGFAAGYGKLTLVALDPSDGSVRWRYQTDWHPYQAIGAPAEAGGVVFTVSDPVPPMGTCSNPQGNLVALRESDGRQLWSVSVGFLPTPPVVANGVVYTSAVKFDECATPPSHQTITSHYALRASDGQQLWRTDLIESSTDTNPEQSVGIDTSLQVVDGTLVATAEAHVSESGDRIGHLFAFDTASGKLRWKNTFFTNVGAQLIVANDLLYVSTHPADAPTLVWTVYRASDGQQVLKLSINLSGQFVLTGAVMYADVSNETAASTPQRRLFDTQVVALDGHSGQQLWQVTTDTSDVNGINSLLAVRDSTVYVQTGPSAFTQKAADHWTLEGVDAQSGHVRWTAPLQWLLGRTLLTDSALYGYSEDMLPGQLMALDPADGHRLWSTPIASAQPAGGFPRSLVMGGGTLYAANESNTVIAVRAQDGATLWQTKMEGVKVAMTVVG